MRVRFQMMCRREARRLKQEIVYRGQYYRLLRDQVGCMKIQNENCGIMSRIRFYARSSSNVLLMGLLLVWMEDRKGHDGVLLGL